MLPMLLLLLVLLIGDMAVELLHVVILLEVLRCVGDLGDLILFLSLNAAAGSVNARFVDV